MVVLPEISLRSDALSALSGEIVSCTRCPRLRAHCEAVARARKRQYRDEVYWGRPVPGFGDPGARLLIVGLAPAAHGGNRTGRVFTGDSSGDWLYQALHRYDWASQPVSRSRDDGLVLRDCWITAAARCAPPDNRPERAELERCRIWLRRELELLQDVRVVVALGRIGWESWLRAAGWWESLGARERPAFGHNVATSLPGGPLLISSFHPSRQNTNTGKLTREMWYAVFDRARCSLPHPERSEGPAHPGFDTR
jgi:uracil-DNA glycosylase family 4